MKNFENSYIKSNTSFIAGVDEVGRGPLAGPVIAGCSHYQVSSKLNEDFKFLRKIGVTDSKKLTDKRRLKILNQLGLKVTKKRQSLFNGRLKICLTEIGHTRIDQINILQASLEAMKKSFLKLQKLEDTILLIDGNKTIESLKRTQAFPVVKGDEKSVLIGLSSILAKVYRDQLMKNYSLQYPHYDFEKNAGYPTKSHRHALSIHGTTPIHRKSFKGVKEYVASEKGASI